MTWTKGSVWLTGDFHMHQYVVIAHWMLCCPVGYVKRGGGLSSHDRLNRTDNYMLLGFLLVWPHNLCSYWSATQYCRTTVLSQLPTQGPVMLIESKFQWPLETQMAFCKRQELGQETKHGSGLYCMFTKTSIHPKKIVIFFLFPRSQQPVLV